MNEELRSANEEIQSSNEELQSTNEELENRNQELGSVNNDLVNLLASVDLPIVMLDSTLRIRRFNPSAQRVLNLIPADVGRPINDLKLTLVVSELEHMIVDVIDTLEVRELEVVDRNKIDGAVLVLIDVPRGKKKS